MRKVPPNSFYGGRNRKTLSDPKIWYEANHISGKDLCIGGLIIFLSSLAMLILGRQVETNHAVAALLIILLLAVGGAAWHGLITIKRM